jgi:AbrB family looped-hinge helix DNA binding protein
MRRHVCPGVQGLYGETWRCTVRRRITAADFVIIISMNISPVNVKIVRVSSKAQITIPKALCERFGLRPGDKVELWVEKGSLRVKPVKPVPKQPRKS